MHQSFAFEVTAGGQKLHSLEGREQSLITASKVNRHKHKTYVKNITQWSVGVAILSSEYTHM